jgi:eukaryotic-like serine/threonine-protein kinase
MNDQRMIGHYRIVELLGSGAMGTVHIAVDTFIERPVAIKSLRPELTQDPEFVSRFRAEAKSLARLNHPNIATLYSSLLDGSDLYMVMELVRGRPLDDVLRDRGKPLSVKQSLAIIAQAADGLSYAHEMGVIHRDVKPSNLMIGNDGRVKIMDFGIARVRGSARLTRAGTAVGTPLYMSPEQCRGGEGDERSDLYSLAIVLYEMLAGAPPFSGATEYDLIQAQIGAAPPPLVPSAIGVTPELESAIMTALAKKPEQRFPSVRAFSDAIGATALRPDATTVVRNATHLIEGPQSETEDSKSPTRALDIAKSRIGALARSFKTLHPAIQGVSAVAAAAVLAAPIYFAAAPSKPPGGLGRDRAASPPGQDRDAGKLDTGSGEPEKRARAKTRVEVGETEPPAQDQKSAKSDGSPSQENPQSQPSARSAPASAPKSSDTSDKLNELRIAIKGDASGKIKASDFEFVANGVKVQLLPQAQSLAAAGVAEAQFVLGMLLLETPGHVDPEGAVEAFTKAANQNYPDAQANLGLINQKKGMLKTGVDLGKARHWFDLAAENGDAKAQFWLGCYYQYGWGGLTKDRRKALEQYEKAVAGNYASAKEALEIMTGTAKGVSPCSK